jgi:hypothetical protein|tara:strand:+ start:40 stop:3708 length:3669 start_codon:yes stop_codon:yes gene_type:complete
MAGTWQDTFKPVNVAEEKDELGNVVDSVAESVKAFPVAAPVTEPVEEPVVEEAPSYQFIPDEEVEPLSSYRFIPDEEVESSSSYQFIPDETVNTYDSLLPVGVVPDSYSEDDLVDDKYYPHILAAMKDRYGIQAIEGESREDVVAKWLNNRTGVYLTNSTRVLSETAYMMDVVKSEDPDRMQIMGTQYALYEAMADVFSEETSLSEKAATVGRSVRTVILDPINLVSLGVGKVAGGVGVKAGVRVMEKFVMAEARKRLAAGASEKSVLALSKEIGRRAQAEAIKHGTDDVARYAATMATTSAGRRVLNAAGLREIGAAAMSDALAGSGFEYLYQDQLVQAGVQEEVNPYAVGLAAVASLAMGGVVAGKVATRGWSGSALVSDSIEASSHKRVADGIQDSLKDNYEKLVESGSSWTSKVKAGSEMDVQDTDFFLELLNGVNDKDGNVIFKGLGQNMTEQGFFWTKRDDADKVSNWVSDFIADMDAEDVTKLVKTFETTSGVKLKGLREFVDEKGVMTVLDEVSPATFSQAFARKMSNVGRSMGAMGNFAKKIGVDIKDLDIEDFTQFALGTGILKKDAVKGGNKIVKAISAGQNRYIRALVSHPSTSFINVLGWGASSTIGSTNDIVRGFMHLGTGGLKRLTGTGDKGITDLNVGKAFLLANVQKMKFMADTDQTYAAFKSALLEHGDFLKRIQQAQSGGIDIASSAEDILGRTAVGRGSEDILGLLQKLTFVEAQDSLTKSVEYMYQMDKGLRAAFSKGYNEFYAQEGVRSVMATKEYRRLLEGTMDKIQEHTFSKSYKKSGLIGEVAGAIEDARNMPGLGMMVPFGRFFNNTIDFTVKNTPVLGNVLKLAGKYPDKTHGELVINGAIAGGLITAMSMNESEKRSQGLGMYDSVDPLTGQVVNQKYDYPLSAFIAAGRMLSYVTSGEKPPRELVEQVAKDFGIGGLTRNLSNTGGLVVDSAMALLEGDVELALAKGGEAVGGVGSQAVAGFTRSFEPVNVVFGLAMGTDMAPQNVKDGNAYLGKSLTYFSHVVEALTGEPFNEALVSSSEGEKDPKLAGVMGIRTVSHTNILRVMNMLAYDSWKYDGKYVTGKLAAGASNEYKRMMFEELDRTAESLVADPNFRVLSTDDKRQSWELIIGQIKDTARHRLATEYTGEESTFYPLVELTEDYTTAELKDGIKESGLSGELGDLTYGQITILKTTMDTSKYVEEVNQQYFVDVK